VSENLEVPRQLIGDVDRLVQRATRLRREIWKFAYQDLEELSAQLHQVYQEEAHRRGDVRRSDSYDELSEMTKEWDRVLARWIQERLRAALSGS